MARRRFDVFHQLMQLDSKDNCQEIVYLVGSYEYPWLIKKSLEFALFRTYAIPSISGLLAKTGQFKAHGQKRYDDTSLLIAEITENGYDSEQGRAAIRIMNRLHGQYNISNDDMLYVLSTFTFEPIRWNTRYGWRTPTNHENLANYHFWVEVGKRMNIKNIPDTIEAFEAFNVNYEKNHLEYAESNQIIANQTIAIMQSWYPRILHPIIRQVIYAMLDDPLRKAFGFPEAPTFLKRGAHIGLWVAAKVLRYMPPRIHPFRLTKIQNKTYPEGYTMENLGADR